MHKEKDRELDESPSPDGSEELYERMSLKIDKGQEPLRIDEFLVARIDPDPRFTRRPVTSDTIIFQHPDTHLFQAPQIPAEIRAEFLQV